MYLDSKIYLGKADDKRIFMNLSMANRHGLITGASGTGKTVSMKVLTESFSDAGVPVFLCDIKGDVSGLCAKGIQSDGMEKRIDFFGIRNEFSYRAYPVTFWDVYGENGHPIRATVSDMGPELLSRILNLTPAQEGVLNIVFRIADDHNLKIIDLKDLKSVLNYVGEHRAEYITTYGNITTASVGAILRALMPLENQGGELFFGEPELDIQDWMRTTYDGKGMINLLDCTKLALNPTLYAFFLLWMMSELYETLPEMGDLEKPKLVFFFDEAHMLFSNAPKALLGKIEQVVKLIRSKGVGIYFVTQNPADIPDSVLAQLSNKIQHALRAYTPKEQKAIRAAAQSFRANPNFDTEEMISQLGVGEALVSVLDEEGIPTIVEYTKIICPQSSMKQAERSEIEQAIASDGMTKYDKYIDNESAFEQLEIQKIQESAEKEKAQKEVERQKAEERARKQLEKKRQQDAAAQKRKSERRKAQIERSLINTAASVFRRGILKILKKVGY
ncbi:MAG: DUF853 family protein [Erysipelotrichaceae bacterium]|nr:DUF853 family protein [Erysipelotrichaceae bacterium]